MSSTPSEFGQLVKVTTEIKYSSLAAATFFFWDYCITFPDEVELIWNLQLLFHTSLATHILLTAAGCVVFIWVQTIIAYSIFLGVELLLVIRLHAFYGRPKGLLIALYILFFVINGAGFLFMAILLAQWVVKPIPSTVPSKFRNVPCFVVKIPKVFPYYWWIHKYLTMGMGGDGLLQVLVRDGAWAFFTVFDSMGGVGVMALLWLHTFLGVVGPRLVLNLRDLDRRRRYPAGAVDVI
ncbi:hypothetical protein BU17DRAFT_63007 [Hysterangium stoloniferum]|nr:hypothetical protein BU17DRAFT_63007 [Hysterangium stoloniferum]